MEDLLSAFWVIVVLFALAASLAVRCRVVLEHEALRKKAEKEDAPMEKVLNELVSDTVRMRR